MTMKARYPKKTPKKPIRPKVDAITVPSKRTDRIQKVLANLGVGSRREIEEWIKAQRLTVNNILVQLGDKISGKEIIQLDKKIIWPKHSSTPKAYSYFKSRHKPTDAPFELETIIYHKPVGEICTNLKETDRINVFSRLPKPKHGKWIMIGRLDLNTSGLLLFTNYGELAHRLMHPSYEITRSYFVRVLGNHDPKRLIATLLKGVKLEDGMAKFDSLEPLKDESLLDESERKKLTANRWYLATLHEGRNREVRRLFESQGLTVSRLVRTGFGGVALPRLLKAGKIQRLTKEEQIDLMALVKLDL
jgi:23S rRNA pseudouridine2605 synthase